MNELVIPGGRQPDAVAPGSMPAFKRSTSAVSQLVGA
jgi:hypothetical protein